MSTAVSETKSDTYSDRDAKLEVEVEIEGNETSEDNEESDQVEEPKTLTQLMEKRKRLQSESYRLQKRLEQTKLDLAENEKVIRKTCQHNWVRDTAYYGPYDKPDDICTICNCINYRF